VAESVNIEGAEAQFKDKRLENNSRKTKIEVFNNSLKAFIKESENDVTV